MNINFLEALEELAKEKNISQAYLLETLEAALISSYKRNFNAAANVRVHIDPDHGTFKVYARKTVVETVEDARLEISLYTAREMNPNYQLGDIVEIEVTPRDFGRIAAQTAKQVVTQRIREAERGLLYQEYVDKESDIINGLISRVDARAYYVDLGKIEGVLLMTEVLPGEQFQVGDRVKAYVSKVENTSRGPFIQLSRTHPGLLSRLFELEVPEIFDGIIELRAIAREAGERSKVAVYSNDEHVDAVGSCVGPRGARVQTIVQELRGEKIDIVEWSEDPEVYVANALSPSRVENVYVREDEKTAHVIVPDHQLSLAIGIRGQNARLAAKLTGWKIDIKSETQAAMEWMEGQPAHADEQQPEEHGDEDSVDREDIAMSES